MLNSSVLECVIADNSNKKSDTTLKQDDLKKNKPKEYVWCAERKLNQRQTTFKLNNNIEFTFSPL